MQEQHDNPPKRPQPDLEPTPDSATKADPARAQPPAAGPEPPSSGEDGERADLPASDDEGGEGAELSTHEEERADLPPDETLWSRRPSSADEELEDERPTRRVKKAPPEFTRSVKRRSEISGERAGLRELPRDFDDLATGKIERLRRKRPERGPLEDSREGAVIPGVRNAEARAVYDVRVARLREALAAGRTDELAEGLFAARQLQLWRARNVTDFQAFAENVVGVAAGAGDSLCERGAYTWPATAPDPIPQQIVALLIRTEAALLQRPPFGHANLRFRAGHSITLELSIPADDIAKAVESITDLGRAAAGLRRFLRADDDTDHSPFDRRDHSLRPSREGHGSFVPDAPRETGAFTEEAMNEAGLETAENSRDALETRSSRTSRQEEDDRAAPDDELNDEAAHHARDELPAHKNPFSRRLEESGKNTAARDDRGRDTRLGKRDFGGGSRGPKRAFDDRAEAARNQRGPRRAFDDRAQGDFEQRGPKRAFDRAQGGSDRPRPKRPFDRARDDFEQRGPKRAFDRARADFEQRGPKRGFDRGRGDFEQRGPKRTFDRARADFEPRGPKRGFGDRGRGDDFRERDTRGSKRGFHDDPKRGDPARRNAGPNRGRDDRSADAKTGRGFAERSYAKRRDSSEEREPTTYARKKSGGAFEPKRPAKRPFPKHAKRKKP